MTNYFATPAGCRFNGDGTTISFLDRYSTSYDKLVSIPLTTAYDLRSFSDGSVNASTRGVDYPATCRFNPDGTKFYILDGTDDKIYQWSLHTPYVLGRGSTAMVYDGVSSSLSLMQIQLLDHLIGHQMVKVYLLAVIVMILFLSIQYQFHMILLVQ